MFLVPRLSAFLCLGFAALAPLLPAQQDPAALGDAATTVANEVTTASLPILQAPVQEEVIQRMERVAREGNLPQYEDLRLPQLNSTEVEERYLETLPLLQGRIFTPELVFADVPDDSPYAGLALRELIAIALQNNFDIEISSRNVLIARSETTSAVAEFIPFIDLFGSVRIAETRRPGTIVTLPVEEPSGPLPEGEERPEPVEQSVVQEVLTDTEEGGIDILQNFPTGGSLRVIGTERRTGSRSTNKIETLEDSSFDSDVDVRFVQPLLRGGGLDVGTADLRRARLSESDEILGDALLTRDVVLSVAREYFAILQIKQSLAVSRDAIRERYNFLNETRIKFRTGRVAESEILRAEIQFLQEVEQAINRQAQLDSARERLLIILGLPLDTPISLIDITPLLADRGRFEIPSLQEAVEIALNSRGELLRSDIAIAVAEINRTVARNETLPQLDFDAGINRFDNSEIEFDRDDRWSDQDWDAGLTLRVPLINIQRREALRRSQLSYENQQTQRLELTRNINREAREAHRTVLTTEANLTILRKTVEQARRNLELINASFKAGFSTITEVRLAQDDLFESETRYNNALLDYQINIAELYVALGLPLQ